MQRQLGITGWQAFTYVHVRVCMCISQKYTMKPHRRRTPKKKGFITHRGVNVVAHVTHLNVARDIQPFQHFNPPFPPDNIKMAYLL